MFLEFCWLIHISDGKNPDLTKFHNPVFGFRNSKFDLFVNPDFGSIRYTHKIHASPFACNVKKKKYLMLLFVTDTVLFIL